MINWFAHMYPYTNLHELNLDWVIATVKAGEGEIKNFINLNTIKYADPILWNIESQYEANTVVVDGQTGNAYISVKSVPSGVHLNRTEYWTQIYNYADVVGTLIEQIAYNEGESTTATRTYSVNDLVFVNGKLYRVIHNMIAGDSFVANSNVVQTTINDELGRLREDIYDEATARANADNQLQTNITDEATARTNADNQLQNNIDTEATARSNADTQLQNNIDTEATARSNADTQLQNSISTVIHNAWNFDFSNCIFLGDSYMETGYLAPEQGFVNVFCSIAKITNYLKFGRSGSGFINDGGSGGHGTYFDILTNEIAPSVTDKNSISFILVEGGANDGAPTYENYRDIVISWINQAKTVFPNATICVMETPTFDVILNNTRLGLKYACELTGSVFIDSGLWLTGNTLYESISNPDHPNSDGCKIIGQNLYNTIVGSSCINYFETVLPKVSDNDIIINASRFIINGDNLTIIVNGGLLNKATRYVPILTYPEHFYNHVGRFEGCAYTELGEVYPVWLTETNVQLDTLVSTSKSTNFQFTINTSIMSLFGLT